MDWMEWMEGFEFCGGFAKMEADETIVSVYGAAMVSIWDEEDEWD
jgi:hypothetical protein